MKIPSIRTLSKNIGYIVITIISSTALGVALALYFMKLITDLAFATGMLAIGTFTLAFLTYQNIRFRNVQEKRNRKERLLNDIIDWALDIQRLTVTTDMSLVTLKGGQFLSALYISLQSPQNRSEYIKSISDTLDKDLKASVDDTSSKLDLSVKALIKVIELPDKSPQVKKSFSKFVRLRVEAQLSANEVIKQTSTIKTSLLT